MSTVDLIVQATITVVVLVDPISRGLFFRVLIQDEPQHRPG